MNSYGIAYQHASPHGVISAIEIPEAPDPVPGAVLDLLLPEEAEHARTLRAFSQVHFVGGRLALRDACGQLGVTPPPILPDDRGAPILPNGISGSISHKRNLAIGLAGAARNGSIGVDLEDYGPARPGIAGHVLTEEEVTALQDLAPDRAWIALLLRFSIKESIYKALDPFVRRYIGFKEAVVHPDLQGGASVRLELAGGEGPFHLDARYEWISGRLLTSVRAQPG